MKRNVFTLTVLLLYCIGVYAQSVQYGYTEEYRGAKEKRGLSGVNITAGGATAKSGSGGRFKLEFNSLKVGDRVNADVENVVSLKGYVLFNKEAVEQWTVSGKSVYFRIVLCRKRMFDELVATYYNVSDRSYREQLRREREKAEALKRDGEIQQAEYERLLKEAEERYDRAFKSLRENADLVARIDESELEGDQREILRLAKEGRLDEAVELIRRGNTVELFARSVAKGEYAAGQEEFYAQKEAEARAEMKRLAEKMKTNIKILQLAGGKENYDLCGEYWERIIAADTTNLGNLKEAGCFYDNIIADYGRAVNCFESALRQCKLQNEKIVFKATLYNDLGDLYSNTSEYEKALAFYDSALIISRKYIENDTFNLMTIYANIGSAYVNIGKYEEAYEQYSKALELFKENVSDVILLAVSEVYNGLGGLYDIVGDYDNAFTYYQKAMEMKLSLQKENDLSLATVYENMGVMYRNKGNYAESLKLLSKSKEMRRALLFETHPLVAYSLSAIADTYFDMGKKDSSLVYQMEALRIRTDVYGNMHDCVAKSYNSIGAIYGAMEKYEDAIKNYEKSLQINYVLFGDSSIKVATISNNIGNIYAKIGEFDKSLEYNKKALDIRKRILGENSIDVAVSYNGIGGVYSEMGKYSDALEYQKKALDVFVVVLGESHPYISVSYNCIGDIYYNMGVYDKAADYISKAIQVHKVALGENNSARLAYLYYNLGSIYNKLNSYEEALESYFTAVEIYIKTYGNQYEKLERLYRSISEVYGIMGVKDKSEEYGLKATAFKKD